MPRPEKVKAVADIKERLEGAQAVFLTEYAGLSVKEQQELRRELKANDAEMKVVKMTLARLAAEGMSDDLTAALLGPTSLTFAAGDPAAAAKALKSFAKGHDVLIIKGGLLGTEFLSPERVSRLADLPSRDVLLAMVAGALAAPMAQMAGLLAALPRNAATLMGQLLEKKERKQAPAAGPRSAVTGGPSAEAPSTDDAVERQAPAAAAEAVDAGEPAPAAQDSAPSTEDVAVAAETAQDQPTEPKGEATEDAAVAAETAQDQPTEPKGEATEDPGPSTPPTDDSSEEE